MKNIKDREKELTQMVFDFTDLHPKINILADHIKDRLPIFSFIIDGIHYNLLVRILNDRFGIQMRGGLCVRRHLWPYFASFKSR